MLSGALVFAALLLAVGTTVVLINHVDPRPTDPMPWSRATLIRADILRLDYTGGSCDTARDVNVSETESVVTLTVVTKSVGACDDVGNPRNIDARLDSDLGNRTLVDGACSTLAGYTDCGKARSAEKATPRKP